MDRANKASDDLQHYSAGGPRSGARHSYVKKKYKHDYRPRLNNLNEGRRYCYSNKNEKNDYEQRNTSNISRFLAQPEIITPAGKYADKTNKKLPIRPILKKEGTNRVRFDPSVQINILPGETSTRKRYGNAPVGHGIYRKQKEGNYRRYNREISLKKEISYNGKCIDGKCKSVACRCSRERSWDRDGVRQSTELLIGLS